MRSFFALSFWASTKAASLRWFVAFLAILFHSAALNFTFSAKRLEIFCHVLTDHRSGAVEYLRW